MSKRYPNVSPPTTSSRSRPAAIWERDARTAREILMQRGQGSAAATSTGPCLVVFRGASLEGGYEAEAKPLSGVGLFSDLVETGAESERGFRRWKPSPNPHTVSGPCDGLAGARLGSPACGATDVPPG